MESSNDGQRYRDSTQSVQIFSSIELVENVRGHIVKSLFPIPAHLQMNAPGRCTAPTNTLASSGDWLCDGRPFRVKAFGPDRKQIGKRSPCFRRTCVSRRSDERLANLHEA